jgi:hypothetical protein
MATRKAATSKGFIGLRLQIPDEIWKTLEAVAFEAQFKISDKIVAEGAKIIRKKMVSLAPDSKKSGTRKSWSKKTKDRRQSVKQLKDTIKSVVRKREHKALAVIGPEYPEGQLVYPLAYGHEMVLWGKRKGGRVKEQDRWVKEAFDTTKSAVDAKMTEVAKNEMAKIIK